ncbi:MAG: tetratricopeptide repeat protein [Candidatus Latescibacteria bacterium]|nr:tetratricopeptide repeat protein [Candidatus Latescibacterota bacterium]
MRGSESGALPEGWRWGVLVGLLALVLRLLYLNESAASPFFASPVIDARTYVDEALALAGGAWAGPLGPFWQAPLYPYFLGVVFRVCGENYWVPRLLQGLLGAASCVLLLRIGRRLFPPPIALGAGLAAALYGPFIYFGGELLPATLALFLYLLFFYSLIRPLCPGPWRWLLSGALLGIAALAVANILLFLPFLILWMFWIPRGAPRPWREVLLLLLGCALPIAPVTARNYLKSGDWVLISSNAGLNFYIGNNPDYERTVNIRPGQDWALLVETPELEAGIKRPAAKSAYFFAKSWRFIADDPLAYLKLQLYKLYLFWRGDEVPRNLDPYQAREDSLVLRLLLWHHGLAFPFGLVGPLALLGIFSFWRSPAGQTPEGRLLLLFLLVYLLSVVLFFVAARYRLLALPFLLLLAGEGLRAIVSPAPQRKILLALLPLLLLAVNLGAETRTAAREGEHHFALGVAYQHRDMQANAIRQYQLALGHLPDHREALLRLAALHMGRGEQTKAIETYRTFLEFHPDAVSVRFLLANACLAAQRFKQAAAEYETLLPLKPQWAELYGRLGYAYLMAAQPARAMWAYRRTLELRPDSSAVRYQLARLCEDQDSLAAAAKEYAVLLTQAPDRPEFLTRLADLLLAQEEATQQTFSLPQDARIREAENHLRLAILQDRAYPASRWSLGLLLARQGRYAEAAEHFERLLALEPKNFQAHYCLANLYRRLHREPESQAQLARYVRASREQELKKQAQKEVGEKLEKLLGSRKTN